MRRDQSLEARLLADALSGRLTRRDVLKRAGALGLSASFVSTLLAACRRAPEATPTAPAAQTPAPGVTPSPAGALQGLDSLRGSSPAGELASDFGKMLRGAIDAVTGLQNRADVLAQKLVLGELGDLHQLTIALEQANIALQLTTQIRNKIIEAYQEIMRMQV